MPKRNSKPRTAQDLADEIEALIADFLASHRAAASAAVQRSFAMAGQARARPRAPRAASPVSAPRRSMDEMSALSERLYAAICARPGESMAVLSPVVGATPRALQLPATRLRRAGRIKTVGQRQGTRYFPMPKSGTRSG